MENQNHVPQVVDENSAESISGFYRKQDNVKRDKVNFMKSRAEMLRAGFETVRSKRQQAVTDDSR